MLYGLLKHAQRREEAELETAISSVDTGLSPEAARARERLLPSVAPPASLDIPVWNERLGYLCIKLKKLHAVNARAHSAVQSSVRIPPRPPLHKNSTTKVIFPPPFTNPKYASNSSFSSIPHPLSPSATPSIFPTLAFPCSPDPSRASSRRLFTV